MPAEIYDAREKTSLFMSQRVEALEAEVAAGKEAAALELTATREVAEAAARRAAAELAAAAQVCFHADICSHAQQSDTTQATPGAVCNAEYRMM